MKLQTLTPLQKGRCFLWKDFLKGWEQNGLRRRVCSVIHNRQKEGNEHERQSQPVRSHGRARGFGLPAGALPTGEQIGC